MLFNFISKRKENQRMIDEFKKYLLSESNSSDAYVNLDNRLLELYGSSTKLKNKINILFISVSNNYLDELKFADYVYRNRNYDACIIISSVSDEIINSICKYVDKNKIYSIINNYEKNGIKSFNESVIKINGVSILGLSKINVTTQREGVIEFDSKPKADIIITDNEKYNNVTNQGVFGLTYYIYKNNVPYYVHPGNKQYKDSLLNGTVEISTDEYEYISFPIE